MRFGEWVRQLRVERRLSQRDLAERVNIDFTYLSKIENSKVAPPSDQVIRQMAHELEADVEQLLALAAKVSQSKLRETVEQDTRVGVLFRKLQSGNLSSEQIRKMLDIVDTGEDIAPGNA